MSFLANFWIFFVPVIVILFAAVAVYATKKRHHYQKQLSGRRKLVGNLSLRQRQLRNVLLLLTMILLLIAMARPSWGTQLTHFEAYGRDVAVVCDVSKSMLATDIGPNRLEHAKFLLKELVGRAKNERFALIPFAGHAFIQCPLTNDKVSFEQYINELSVDSIPLGGTNIELALKTALEALNASGSGSRAIILITDGDELTGDSVKLAEELKKKDIPVIVIGIGDPVTGTPIPDTDGTLKRDADNKVVTTKLNEEQLRKIAQISGGMYVRSTVVDPGVNLVSQFIDKLDKQQQTSGSRSLPIERFMIFLIAALALLLVFLIVPECKKKAALLLLLALGPAAQSADLPRQEQPVIADKAPQTPAATDPVSAYNTGRSAQLAQKNDDAVREYEAALAAAKASPEVRSASLFNLGVLQHQSGKEQIQKAYQELQSQSPDGALKELNQANEKLKTANELYGSALSSAKMALQTQNLQILADDAAKVEELRKKIEELKKQQQQAQKDVQNAQKDNQQQQNQQQQNQQQQNQQQQNQQQQNQQQQNQQQQNQQQQNQQNQQQQNQQQQQQSQQQNQQQQNQQQQNQQQQNQQQQNQQQQNQQQSQQQNQQGQQDKQQSQQQQQNQQNAIDQAKRSVDDLQKKADELKQNQLKEQAQKAGKELDKAKQSQQNKDFDTAKQHLDKAKEELGGGQGKDQQKDQKGDSKDQKDQKDQKGDSKDQKDQNGDAKDQKDQQKQDDKEALPQPGQNGKEEQKPDKLDKDSAEKMLEILADQEKDIRDAIRQNNQNRRIKVEKDW